MKVQHAETVVVGGGPIGIEVAVELRSRGIDARVLEAGMLGHTISWWAPQTRWFSSNDRIAIAGVPLHTVDQSKASREEYLNYLRVVVDQFEVPISTFTKVKSIEPAGTPQKPAWRILVVNNGISRIVEARAIVMAIGGTDSPNRLEVPGESLAHVDGYLREIHRYHGRRVMIIGGRNSAVEAAIRLHRGGAKVSLSYHRENLPTDGIKYWLRPEIEGLIRSGSIRAWFRSKVTRIDSESVVLETESQGGQLEQVRVPADDVLPLIGYRQNQDLFGELGVLSAGTNPKPIYDPQTMMTNREGVYVAGTAIGGTQSSKYQIFLENCHDHSIKIADHLSERFGKTRHRRDANHNANQGAMKPDACADSPPQGPKLSDTLSRRISLQPES